MMKEKDREEFFKWYHQRSLEGKEYNFKEELIRYCKADVRILRLASTRFRNMFFFEFNVDPFIECTTIASTSMRVFRKNFLKQNQIGIIPIWFWTGAIAGLITNYGKLSNASCRWKKKFLIDQWYTQHESVINERCWEFSWMVFVSHSKVRCIEASFSVSSEISGMVILFLSLLREINCSSPASRWIKYWPVLETWQKKSEMQVTSCLRYGSRVE